MFVLRSVLLIYIPYGKNSCVDVSRNVYFPAGKRNLGVFLRRRSVTIEKNVGCNDSSLGDEWLIKNKL